MSPAESSDWIAAHHADGRLRGWRFGAGGEVHAAAETQHDGDVDGALTALTAQLSPDTPLPTLVSGHPKAPLRPVPCTPLDPDQPTVLIPGLSQSRPADTLQGAEVLIAGFLAETPDFDGTLCLAGGLTRWVQISAGEVVSFRSFMTLDLHAALAQTRLRPHLGSGHDPSAFLEAVAEGMARPEAFAQRLATLPGTPDLTPDAANAMALGGLIGAELVAARGYWLGTRLALIGPDAQATPYAQALASQGVAVERADPDAMLLAGLRAAGASAFASNTPPTAG